MCCFGEWNVTVDNGFNLPELDEGNLTVEGSSPVNQIKASLFLFVISLLLSNVY